MSSYNLSRFDFISIKLAVICAQKGSLTAAARDCNLVLPAASRRIQDLEKTIGNALFHRHSRGLVPTETGRAFVKHGLELLQCLDELVQDIDGIKAGVARHVRLTSSTAAINQFLPSLLAEYAVRHPEIHVALDEQVSDLVVGSLREGRFDLGAYVEGPFDEDLDTRDFRKDVLVLILPQGHKLIGKAPIQFADTLDENWISLNAGAALLMRQQQTALEAGRPFKLRMQVRSFDAVAHMVASGLGIAVLPKAAALPIIKAMKLSWRPLSDDWAQRQLKIAMRRDGDSAVRAFRDFLCEPSRNAKA
jgi:DNA-binding transcriptional LysR family regulator